VSQDVRPLYIWGNPDMTKLKAAKDMLDLPYLLKRTPARPGAPGISGRVLAFGEMPPFACDYALVRSDAGMKDALSWACGLTEDRRAASIATWLTNILGGKVVELDRA
jgi:hypothetical protein